MSMRLITAVAAAAVAAAALTSPAFADAPPPGYAAPPAGYHWVKDDNDNWILVAVAALAGIGTGYAIGNDNNNNNNNNPPPVSGQSSSNSFHDRSMTLEGGRRILSVALLVLAIALGGGGDPLRELIIELVAIALVVVVLARPAQADPAARPALS